jgi:hypothetical protein
MSEGIKNDAEKIRLELFSSTWLFGVGRVLTFGAKKYAAHNWRKGLEISRLLGACLRHVLAFLGGEDNDPETGLLHLYHASCCLMFASELYCTHPELDDRWKENQPDLFDDDDGKPCVICNEFKSVHLEHALSIGHVVDRARGHCYRDTVVGVDDGNFRAP